ncbi:hypothetical protein EsH8_VIII_000397 [Colletotrichum jinshuiense]
MFLQNTKMKTQAVAVLSLVAAVSTLPFLESNKASVAGTDATIEENPANRAREEADAIVQEYPAKWA